MDIPGIYLKQMRENVYYGIIKRGPQLKTTIPVSYKMGSGLQLMEHQK